MKQNSLRLLIIGLVSGAGGDVVFNLYNPLQKFRKDCIGPVKSKQMIRVVEFSYIQSMFYASL